MPITLPNMIGLVKIPIDSQDAELATTIILSSPEYYTILRLNSPAAHSSNASSPHIRKFQSPSIYPRHDRTTSPSPPSTAAPNRQQFSLCATDPNCHLLCHDPLLSIPSQ
ncbi:uncharacterized protein PAC_08513 [Phialocephala subalpina]|uniref:Uncharacterized protein n=1 Tax=Phialocephala subalpina TaxID=576137 RepID=A0A1L7X0S9_9HELO|nr:uncharacterized protein PAC_08513 [Phialocephala subalpina]